LNERSSTDRARRGHARASTSGLDEAHTVNAKLRRVLNVGQRDRLKDVAETTHANRCAADLPTARVPRAGNLARPAHVDPGAESIRKSESVGLAKFVEIAEFVGRWWVVVGHSHVERQSSGALDGLGGYPRQ
jgi:hypothetical protein